MFETIYLWWTLCCIQGIVSNKMWDLHTVFNKFCSLLHTWIRCELSSSSTRVRNLGMGICWVWCGRQSFQVKTLKWRLYGGVQYYLKAAFNCGKDQFAVVLLITLIAQSLSQVLQMTFHPSGCPFIKRIWSFWQMDIACILQISLPDIFI